MQTMVINATVDPRAAEVGFNKVAASANITANKISSSMARARSALATTSQSMAGVAKAFVTIELGKRAISGLIELAKQSKYNKKLMDDMAKSTSKLASALSTQMEPAVEFWTGAIKTITNNWLDFLDVTQNTDAIQESYRRTNVMAREQLDIQEDLRKVKEGTYAMTKGEINDANIKLSQLNNELKIEESLRSRMMKGARAQAEAQAKKDAADKKIADDKTKRDAFDSRRREFDATNLQKEVNAKRAAAQEDLKNSRDNEAERQKLDEEVKDAEFNSLIEQQKRIDEKNAAQADASNEAIRREFADRQSYAQKEKKIDRDDLASKLGISQAQADMAAKASEASANGFATAQIMFGKNKKLAAGEAVARGGVAVMNALSVQPWWLGLSQAALATAMTAQTVNQINGAKAAATGADFVTNGPQLMLVGENSGGRERVQVTPLSSPNINGPKGNDGGSGAINFQPIIYMTGEVARDEAYTDRALRSFGRKVQEARRMGYI